jgi:G3E family GTPase
MPSSSVPSQIPITVFTGFLGAGKTSLILSLLPQLPNDYRVVLLKNEFGDIEGSSVGIPRSAATNNVSFTPVDSQLAKQSSLTAVSEILNGCMSESFLHELSDPLAPSFGRAGAACSSVR